MIRNIRNLILFCAAAALIVMLAWYEPTSSGKGIDEAREHGSSEGHNEHGGEGVELTDAKLAAAGIELLTAGPATLNDTLILNGVLRTNQETLVQVTPRFPGIVRDLNKRIGERVEKGALLAKIESNQSLTVYELRAPIAGTVIDRQVSLGEYANEQKPAFVIADLSTVWVDLSVYRRDLSRVRLDDTVLINPDDGGPEIEAKISYVSPIGNNDTQSAIARATVANEGQRLRPGLFVTGKLILSSKNVPLAVKQSALQTVENRTVVFVRNGPKFDPREVELGQRDPEHVEVLYGLLDGEIYAAKNSFVIKAELAKGSASHEH